MCYLCSDEFDTFLLFNSFFIFARLSELMRYNLVCQTFPSALKATSNARNLRNYFEVGNINCNAIIGGEDSSRNAIISKTIIHCIDRTKAKQT
mmetsp:Transcript_13481/g.18253  ORF Transcript_13481/g.18253 Transcript_13481/m.18253 type:complete len:93 (+) Transcript_13481:1067-1345(+)